jgi:hypothetical protein
MPTPVRNIFFKIFLLQYLKKVRVCNSCIWLCDLMFCNTCILLCDLFMFKFLIFVIIIGFHIIWNMSWVYKHMTKPSTMWSIPCSLVMNDILLSNVNACENDHNMVFTHVPLQCPFTCATRYFGEWEFHYINDIGSICPKLHHSQWLVGTHGWVE